MSTLALAMGLAACSSPMPPWQQPRTTIQPAPHAAPPAATRPVSPAAAPQTSTPDVAPQGAAAAPARVGMANPASVYCLQRGGQLEISSRPGGGEVGICVSPRGDECEEWSFLRGSCTW
jgi:putative hemolysin